MFDDLKILRFRHRGIAVVVELKHFAFRHLLAGLGEHLVDPMVSELDDLAEGFGVEIVADEDADLISPDFSGGSPAPADIGIVHDVVVQEGGGMDEFHQTAELVMFAAGIAAETGRQQEKQGSDSFSAAVEDVGGNRIDEGHAGIKILVGSWSSTPSSSSR